MTCQRKTRLSAPKKPAKKLPKDPITRHAYMIWAKAERTGKYSYCYRLYRKSKHWRRLKQRLAKKRPKRCEKCGSRAGIVAHHLVYREWWNIRTSDLMWLCDRHHKEVHRLIDRGTIRRDGSVVKLRAKVLGLFE